MIISACGLLPNPAKVPCFQYRAWWYFIVKEFDDDDENFQESQIWASMLHFPTAMIRPKSQNPNRGHDGILSIGNFILMVKNHIPLETNQQPKNVLPISY
jgi:hypothetical protein